MDKVLTKYTSRGVIELLLKDFVFQRKFIIFSNFLLLAVLSKWYTPMYHEQSIFIIYDSAGREKNNFGSHQN